MANPKSSAPKEYLTLDEVAEYLHVSRDTALRMVQRGEIRAVKIGNGARNSPWRSRTDWVDQWAEKNAYDPNA